MIDENEVQNKEQPVETPEKVEQAPQNVPQEKKKVSNKPKRTCYAATGRRKESSARVRIFTPGTGKIVVNKRTIEDYFPRETHRIVIEQPLSLTKVLGKIDINVNVAGGGSTGQAEATRHGITRALVMFDESLKTTLKKAGFLTRDSRAKERKKYGRKRARKKFQFSKR